MREIPVFNYFEELRKFPWKRTAMELFFKSRSALVFRRASQGDWFWNELTDVLHKQKVKAVDKIWKISVIDIEWVVYAPLYNLENLRGARWKVV